MVVYWRAGEQCCVNVVFPKTRKSPFADHLRHADIGLVTIGLSPRCSHQGLALRQIVQASQGYGFDVAQRQQRLDQAETRGQVVGNGLRWLLVFNTSRAPERKSLISLEAGSKSQTTERVWLGFPGWAVLTPML